jgi:hypothetical protein
MRARTVTDPEEHLRRTVLLGLAVAAVVEDDDHCGGNGERRNPYPLAMGEREHRVRRHNVIGLEIGVGDSPSEFF